MGGVICDIKDEPVLWALIVWPFMTSPYNTFSTAQLFSNTSMSISPRPWVKSNKFDIHI